MLSEKFEREAEVLCHKLQDNLFQKDGLTTAKLLCWAVEVWASGATKLPCATEQRNLWPEIELTETQKLLKIRWS